MVYWVDNKTAVKVKPNKNPLASAVATWFSDQLGQTPTIPQADWFNMIQSEILGIASALNITPDKLNDSQIGVALKKALQDAGSVQINVVDDFGTSITDAGSQRLITQLKTDVENKKLDKFVRYLHDEHINNANQVGLYVVYSDVYQTKENGYPDLKEVLPTNACFVRVTMIDNSAMLQELFNEEQYFIRRLTTASQPVWIEYFNDLHLSQTTGTDERKLMSQKAITDSTCALGDIQDTPTYSLNQTFGDNMAAAITTVPKNAVIVGAYSEKWPAAAVRFRPIVRTGGGNLV